MDRIAFRAQCILRRAWLAAVVLSVVALPTSSFADVCGASGSLSILGDAGFSCPTGLQPGDVLNYTVRVNNNSQTVGGVPVDSVLTGVTTLTEACDTSASPCPLSFPDALTFNGCVAPTAPGVACALNGGNQVDITLPGGGLAIAADGSALIATVQFIANVPVDTADCGLFFTRGDTGPTDLVTADDLCSNQVTGGAQGSTNAFYPECVSDDQCDDGNACNGPEVCDPNGQCQDGTPPVCDDMNLCTDDSCDPAVGCVYTPIDPSICDDDNFCTADSCDPELGCVNDPIDPATCDDDNFCTSDSCDPAVGCVNDPIDPATCDDDNFCTDDDCDPAVGCVNTPIDPASCDDANFCTDDSCDPAVGCVNDPIDPATCDDEDFCTDDSCDPAVGCVNDPIDPEVDCDDDDICTLNECDPAVGCVNPPDPDPDPSCVTTAVCRTPGFWGARGGYEKGNQNITQTVIDAAPGGFLSVCGQIVDSTVPVGDLSSALEAMCVKTRGVHQRSLYRALVAAALNCVVSGADDCNDLVPWDTCNDACAMGDNADPMTVQYCIGTIDCWNNGGEVGMDGVCSAGTCSVDGMACGHDAGDCAFIPDMDNHCVAYPNNCHDRSFCDSPNEDFCDLEPFGGASSPRACNAANNNSCTIDSCEESAGFNFGVSAQP